ncbi:CZB domain-containing protein [Marinobacterium weihaiense]|uniref:CZB domain-containing protein n=1 Tax=Marinobacterium weihaiense TaxID=2851016 RepID=A0ABS6MDC3_9GAMM|nr:CZB domain-containing protein [Marinobacterium weihaiense]MBV0934289.1 CZB domain-containing protein [Marinobacterium weihaiense]
MGFRRWLIKALGGQATPNNTDTIPTLDAEAFQEPLPEPEDPLEAEAAGLDFKSAIEAHQRWKSRLNDVIQGRSQETLDPSTVARDDCCALGKWIHGNGGAQFSGQPEFAELKRQHAHFHVCAGHVLLLAQSGRRSDAETEIHEGDFARISREVVLRLAQMYTRLKAQTD